MQDDGHECRGFNTRAAHILGGDKTPHGATNAPLYLSSGFSADSADELAERFAGRRPGYIYSRISNPGVSAFEQQFASLEEGRGAIACSSGMAAISAVILTLCRTGDRVVAGSSLFGGTLMLFDSLLERMGVDVEYIDPSETQSFARAAEGAALCFVESIGNPKLDVVDVGALAEICSNEGTPLVVDSTLATPYAASGRALGAHLTVHSTTKFAAGTGNSVGGLVVDTGLFDWKKCRDPEVAESARRFGKELGFLALARRQVTRNTGNGMAPFDAFLQCTGLQTLGLRMERHCANAQALARFLERHELVESVNYPGLQSSPWYDIATRQFGTSCGALLTLRLGSSARALRFIDALDLAINTANLGDVRTMVIHPASTIYRDLSERSRAAAGVTDDLVRVSVGIEQVDDLIHDFDRALRNGETDDTTT